jgi:phosphoglycolate phosphatase
LNLARASCFVFDFDGTLAPNLDLPEMRRQLIRRTLEQGVPPAVFEHRYIIEIIDAADDWLIEHKPGSAARYSSEAHRFITSFELEAASRVEPFPGVRDLLERMRRTARRTAVVTRNCEQAVRNTFPDIDDHLDVLLARDNVEHYKPHPAHLQNALCALGGTASQSVMVGDGQMDMRLGRSLGLTCVGVLSGSHGRAQLEDAGADLVLNHVTELKNHF